MQHPPDLRHLPFIFYSCQSKSTIYMSHLEVISGFFMNQEFHIDTTDSIFLKYLMKVLNVAFPLIFIKL